MYKIIIDVLVFNFYMHFRIYYYILSKNTLTETVWGVGEVTSKFEGQLVSLDYRFHDSMIILYLPTYFCVI